MSAPSGTLRMSSRSGSANGLSAASNGGLADLVADAERERVTNQTAAAAPPPPVSGRMLRVEVHGLLHDWFDVADMGDFIRSPAFAGTLRENVARYFGVPLERQAIYDEDGLLTTCADFSRALQRVYPKLYVYDLDEMGPELRARAVEELRQLDAEVEQSWRHFGAGGSPPSRSAGSGHGNFDRMSNGTGPASDGPARSPEGACTGTVERSYIEGGSGGTGWQLAGDQATGPAVQVSKASSEQAFDQATVLRKLSATSVVESDLAPRVLPASAYVKPCDDFNTIKDMSTRYVAGPPDEMEVRICSTPPRNSAATEALEMRHVAPLASPEAMDQRLTSRASELRGPLQVTSMQGGSSTYKRFLDAGAGVGGGVGVSTAASCFGELPRSASGRLLVQQGQPILAEPVSTPGRTSRVDCPVRIITPTHELHMVGSQPGTPRAVTPRTMLQQVGTPVQLRVQHPAASYPLGATNGMGGPPQACIIHAHVHRSGSERALHAQTPPRSQTPTRSPRWIPGDAEHRQPCQWQQQQHLQQLQQPQVQQQLLQQQLQQRQRPQQLQQPNLLQAPNVQLQLSASWQTPSSGLPAPPGINFNFQPHLPQLQAGFNSMQAGLPPGGAAAAGINRGNSTPGAPVGAAAIGTMSPGVPMAAAMHGAPCGTASPRVAFGAATPGAPPGSAYPAMIMTAETRSPRRQESRG
eukprot:TRINITY_DN23239_c0_g1_i1.p1 TRINITY_DN23239_c0_g1~~TRINITY_DN23239_c0_g1_i1.p1  ORF type:complete len:695 (+),score=116.16 TRINITY_DN23239_c0_g1_i1:64-2148(+)